MVFFNHYYLPNSSYLIRLPRGLVSVSYYKGSQVSSHLVLVSRSLLVLSQPSDVSDLVPLCLVSISLLSPMSFATLHICLSQAYSCSDRYKAASDKALKTQQSVLSDHFGPSEEVIPYSERAFEVASIEWLVHTNQVFHLY